MALLRPLFQSARIFRHSSASGLKHLLKSCPTIFLTSANKSSASAMSYTKEKAKYLQMPQEEKRKHYNCENFVTLEQVPTWPEWAKDNTLTPPGDGPKIDYDEELNNKVSYWEGDITSLEIDVIVNAANSRLFWGGGVCGAIFSAAEGKLEEECKDIKPCEEGSAKQTGGYKLPARFILHAVGPTNRDPVVLKSCYTTCLDLLDKSEDKIHNLRSIAFPCIATGIFGFPNEEAAKIAVSTARNFLQSNRDRVDRIIFCLFTPDDKKLYKHYMQIYFPLQETCQ